MYEQEQEEGGGRRVTGTGVVIELTEFFMISQGGNQTPS